MRELTCGAASTRSVLPFSVPEMDQALPGGGLAFGALHEVADGGGLGRTCPSARPDVGPGRRAD